MYGCVILFTACSSAAFNVSEAVLFRFSKRKDGAERMVTTKGAKIEYKWNLIRHTCVGHMYFFIHIEYKVCYTIKLHVKHVK